MKAGIITNINTNDYGMILQSWALQKVLKEYGLDAGLINFHPNTEDYIRPVKKDDNSKGILRYLSFLGSLKGNQLRNNKASDFSRNLNILGSYKDMEELQRAKLDLDVYITDTTSIGNDSIKEIQEFTDGKLKQVPAPALLLTKKEYDEVKVKSRRKGPFLLLYTTGNNPGIITLANSISKSLGLSVAGGRRLPYEAADAGEFLGLLDEAAYIITDSIQGCVFSILYEKPFIYLQETAADAAAIEFLTGLGLQSHILDKAGDYKGVSQFSYENEKQLHKLIKQRRAVTTAHLIKNLALSDRYQKVKCPTKITKEKCYGCNACVESCNAGAIRMKTNKEGFLYPVTDYTKCVNCGLCEKVCIRKHPLNIEYKDQYPKAYTVYHLDNSIRQYSSSGAVFPALAKYAIEVMHGVVVGVRFDENMKVIADIADSMETAKAFSGSKYVKSDFRGIFPKIKELLKEGRFVLYSGLPCECAALRAYLRRDYENLLVCELICHAAPSPKVFQKYIEYLNTKYGSKVKNIIFRDKRNGWKIDKATMAITLENGKVYTNRSVKDLYFRAFLDEYIIRPSCNHCNYVYNKRTGDITIGDCWGVDRAAPELFDDKGVSMILVNTGKGDAIWDTVKDQFKIKENDIKDIFYKNHVKPSKDSRKRTAFFHKLDQEPIEVLFERYNKK